MKIAQGRPRFFTCWSNENRNQSLKREGKRFLMDSLTNKVFSKVTLSENFKIKLFLNRGLQIYVAES